MQISPEMWLRPSIWLTIAALLAFTAWMLLRARPESRYKVGRKVLVTSLTVLCACSTGVGIYLAAWFHEHSIPQDTVLFRGVRYVRSVNVLPRPVVAHLVFVDLKAPGLTFVVTSPPDGGASRIKAATVKEFAQKSGAQIAINANFFHPFHSNSPWDFYPKSGDPVEMLGIAASSGKQYSRHQWNGATLYISRSNEAQLGGIVSEIWNAVSGDQWLIKDGAVVAGPDSFGPYPRCGAALNVQQDTLILALVDGKQPGFSEGLTLPGFAEMLQRHGAHNAVNFDGGGSVTLVSSGTNGTPVALNSPIHTRVPGRQRPVAVHLGLKVER